MPAYVKGAPASLWVVSHIGHCLLSWQHWCRQRFPNTRVALLKALSLLPLIRVRRHRRETCRHGRENRFFSGLLMGCEVFVGAIAASICRWHRSHGEPQLSGRSDGGGRRSDSSLGNAARARTPFVHRRRLVLYAVCHVLDLSQSRPGRHGSGIDLRPDCCAWGCASTACLRRDAAIILVMVALGSILRPDAVSDSVSTMTASLLYKGKIEIPACWLHVNHRGEPQSRVSTITYGLEPASEPLRRSKIQKPTPECFRPPQM